MHADDFLPFLVPVVLYAFGGASLWFTLKWWICVIGVSSFIFAMIALNAGHHHPENIHDGDLNV